MERELLGAVFGGSAIFVGRIIFDWLKPSLNGNGKVDAALTKKTIEGVSSDMGNLKEGIGDLKQSSNQTNFLLADILSESKETRRLATEYLMSLKKN